MKKRILCLAMVLCMIAALLPVTASAAVGDSFGIIPSAGTTGFTIGTAPGNQGFNETLYYKAHDKYQGGIATSNSSDWIVRVKHSADGYEITLKDAYIVTNDGNSGDHLFTVTSSQPVIVKLEGNNVLENRRNYGGAALRFGGTGGAVITGDGTLTVSNESCGSGPAESIKPYTPVIDCSGDLKIKDTTVTVTSSPLQNDSYAWHGIRCGGDMTIDNSTVTIDTRNVGIYMGSNRSTLTSNGSVTITNGSKVSISSQYYAINLAGTLTIDATVGTQVEFNTNMLTTRTTSGTKATFNSNTYPAFAKTPVLTGNYVATASSDKTLAETTPYEATENTALASTGYENYRYFRLAYAAPAEPEPFKPVIAPALNNSLDVYVGAPKDAVDASGYAVFAPADGSDPIKVNLTEEEECFVAAMPNLAAKQMTDTYTVTIYNGEDEAVSTARTFSIADYALMQLRNTDNATLKQLLVDMLVYGAMAQNQFGYDTDKLATAALTSDELALATQLMTACENTLQTANGYKGTNFILESSIEMATAFDKAVVGEGAYAIVTFKNHKGEDITSEKIYENATYSNEYNAIFVSKDLAAADGRCDVTWTIYNAADEEVCTIVDSLESYAARAIAAGDTFVEKLMIYSDSAKAYFDTLA